MYMACLPGYSRADTLIAYGVLLAIVFIRPFPLYSAAALSGFFDKAYKLTDLVEELSIF